MNGAWMKKVWFDGRYIDWDTARIHILTHALHYGSSVFEGIRFYATDKGQKIFRLNDHIKRFFYSAKALGLAIPYTQKTLFTVCKKIVAMSGMEEGYLRPIAFFGAGSLSINPAGFQTRVVIFFVSVARAQRNDFCLHGVVYANSPSINGR